MPVQAVKVAAAISVWKGQAVSDKPASLTPIVANMKSVVARNAFITTWMVASEKLRSLKV